MRIPGRERAIRGRVGQGSKHPVDRVKVERSLTQPGICASFTYCRSSCGRAGLDVHMGES